MKSSEVQDCYDMPSFCWNTKLLLLSCLIYCTLIVEFVDVCTQLIALLCLFLLFVYSYHQCLICKDPCVHLPYHMPRWWRNQLTSHGHQSWEGLGIFLAKSGGFFPCSVFFQVFFFHHLKDNNIYIYRLYRYKYILYTRICMIYIM